MALLGLASTSFHTRTSAAPVEVSASSRDDHKSRKIQSQEKQSRVPRRFDLLHIYVIYIYIYIRICI